MSRQKLTAILLAAALLPILAGCSVPAATPPAPTEEAIELIPADFAGEWVLTRTVETSDDPALVVGDESVRYVLFTIDDCTDDECEGVVTSGLDTVDRTDAPFTQSGDSITYELSGTQDCIYDDGSVAFPEALDWDQALTMTADEKDGDTVTTLVGESTYNFASTPEAEAAGCPVQSGTVTYSYVGVRG